METVKINTGIKPVLTAMQTGEVKTFPLHRKVDVRNSCSQLKRSGKGSFATKQLNELELIEVTKVN